jgi:CHAT domain-containing protein
LRLKNTGPGAFAGQLPLRALMHVLSGCGGTAAQLRFARTAIHTQQDYEQAGSRFQEDDRAVRAYLQGIQGDVHSMLTLLEEATSAKEKRLGPTHPQLLPNYFLLAQLHQAQGTYSAELPLYRKAVAVCESAYGPQSTCTAWMLTSLSGSLLQSGEYTEAESAARRALGICNKVFGAGNPLCGVGLDGLGAVLIDAGRYSEGEITVTQALDANKKVYGSDSPHVGLSLTNLSVLYRFTGQYAKAEQTLRQALAIDRKALGADSPLTILDTIVLGQILRLSGHYPEAEASCRGALDAATRVLERKQPDHPALSTALLCEAEILREMGRYGEAEPLYRRALANDSKYLGPDHPSVAIASVLLGKLLRVSGNDADATRALKNAYRIAHISGNQALTWRVASELMLLYGRGSQPRPELAIFYGKEAVNDLQQLRGNLNASSAEVQRAFVSAAEVGGTYKALAEFLIADGRLVEAQQVLAMLKEKEFYDFTRDASDADSRKTVASLSAPEKQLDAISSREVSLGQQYAALQRKFTQDHQLAPAEREQLNTLRKAMDAAQSQFDARVTAVALDSKDPEAQRRRRQEITDLSRSFQGTLKEMGHDAVLAQYFILDDKVQILLTTPSAVVAREVPIKRSALNEQIMRYRQTLSSPAQDPIPQADALYSLLIGPIAGDLRQAAAKVLMLSLDDTLRYLPFAALHGDSGYLIENFSIAIVNEAVRDKLANPPGAKWSVWALGVTKAHPGAEPLPWAGIELNDIAGPKGILNGKVMLDSAFSEAALRDGLDQAYPIIHVASHFRFAPGSMDESVLLLGDGSLMTLAQIKNNLNFNGVELLTLSACETAVGDDGVAHHGIEVEGLGAIAQQAGAKAVLATLWSVADSSTALLMRTLYAAHRDDHVTKAEALRYSQLALLHGSVRADPAQQGTRGLKRIATPATGGSFKADPNAPFAHPYFWAPFILMGNWL